MSHYLLYDFLQVAGGAERLMLELARGMPDRELIVSRRYPESNRLDLSREVKVREIGSPFTRLAGRIPEAVLAFRHRARFLARARSALYSGYYAPLAVRHQREGLRAYYCHTPPRFVYDMRDFYLGGYPAPLRRAASAAFALLRHEYEGAIRRMDLVISNSRNVQARLERYCGIASTVVHPPIDTSRFRYVGDDGYFVSLARLAPYKRVDLVVRAFREMPDQRLVVASGGPELSRLQALADGATNITFAGWQDDAGLAELVGRSRAAIYVPKDEDFGMSPVEAMAAGKPVIGVAEGGLLETIVPGVTGVLLEPAPGIEAVIRSVRSMNSSRASAMRQDCIERASAFSTPVFLDRMRALMLSAPRRA